DSPPARLAAAGLRARRLDGSAGRRRCRQAGIHPRRVDLRARRGLPPGRLHAPDHHGAASVRTLGSGLRLEGADAPGPGAVPAGDRPGPRPRRHPSAALLLASARLDALVRRRSVDRAVAQRRARRPERARPLRPRPPPARRTAASRRGGRRLVVQPGGDPRLRRGTPVRAGGAAGRAVRVAVRALQRPADAHAAPRRGRSRRARRGRSADPVPVRAGRRGRGGAAGRPAVAVAAGTAGLGPGIDRRRVRRLLAAAPRVPPVAAASAGAGQRGGGGAAGGSGRGDCEHPGRVPGPAAARAGMGRLCGVCAARRDDRLRRVGGVASAPAGEGARRARGRGRGHTPVPGGHGSRLRGAGRRPRHALPRLCQPGRGDGLQAPERGLAVRRLCPGAGPRRVAAARPRARRRDRGRPARGGRDGRGARALSGSGAAARARARGRRPPRQRRAGGAAAGGLAPARRHARVRRRPETSPGGPERLAARARARRRAREPAAGLGPALRQQPGAGAPDRPGDLRASPPETAPRPPRAPLGLRPAGSLAPGGRFVEAGPRSRPYV
ncbi:MAG: hypothetical protein AVDCRST_MAG45-2409, partial [uncultured Solirubrobacterales bacterium]